MKQYHDALRQIYQDGIDRGDRTGVGTRSLFGLQMRFDLQEGFPAVTTKKLAWKAVVSELLWFLEGSDDERRLAEIHYGKPREELIGKTTIWTANADAQGKKLGHENTDMVKQLGPVYGVQWRNFDYYNGSVSGIDQIEQLIEGIKSDPSGRRHILSAWNPILISEMALPPCHCFAQFFVHNGKLSCQMYQRSADMFLGVPFNIASYALLTHMIAQVCGLDVGELIMTFGDAHIYNNHFEQVKTQLEREPYKLPTLWLNPNIDNIDDFGMEHIALTNYVSHDTIKAPMAV
jgi:thymidylate synthase